MLENSISTTQKVNFDTHFVDRNRRNYVKQLECWASDFIVVAINVVFVIVVVIVVVLVVAVHVVVVHVDVVVVYNVEIWECKAFQDYPWKQRKRDFRQHKRTWRSNLW